MRQDLPPPIAYRVRDPFALPPELGARTGDLLVLDGDRVFVVREMAQRWSALARTHAGALEMMDPQQATAALLLRAAA
jgi:hypothetical protein